MRISTGIALIYTKVASKSDSSERYWQTLIGIRINSRARHLRLTKLQIITIFYLVIIPKVTGTFS
jgi:hypothetical protein